MVGCSWTGQSVDDQCGHYRDWGTQPPDPNLKRFDVLNQKLAIESDITRHVPNDPTPKDAWDQKPTYFYDNYFDCVTPTYTPETKSCTGQAFQLLGYIENVKNVVFPIEFPWGTTPDGKGWWRACKAYPPPSVNPPEACPADPYQVRPNP